MKKSRYKIFAWVFIIGFTILSLRPSFVSVDSTSIARSLAESPPSPSESKNGPREGPDWLYHEGFRAIIGTIQDTNFIYVDAHENGLIFYACEHGYGNGDAVINGDMSPDKCPTILNNDSIAISPDLLLTQSLGIKRLIMTGLKIVGSGAVIVASNLSWSGASGAYLADTMLPMATLTDMTELHRTKKLMADILKYGDMSASKQDHQIVTELINDPYQNIKQGVITELTGVVRTMLKNDKTLGMEWKVAYHTLINQRYNQPKSDPSPSASASVTVSP